MAILCIVSKLTFYILQTEYLFLQNSENWYHSIYVKGFS